MTLPVVIVILLFASAIALFFLLRRTGDQRRKYVEHRQSQNTMNPSEAKSLADRYTADWNKELRSELSKREEINVGPITLQFLSKYAEYASPNGAHRLGFNYLSKSKYVDGFVVIGQTDYREICVSSGSDVICVIESSDRDRVLDDSYPSVYHLLLDYGSSFPR
jgi:hypothetical protein